MMRSKRVRKGLIALTIATAAATPTILIITATAAHAGGGLWGG